MLERKRVALATRTTSSTKLIGATALLIGVALGGYLLNMAGAAVRCASDSCTVISRLTSIHQDLSKKIDSLARNSTGGWMYVYGPDKNSSQDLNNLINYVNQGGDVKVQVMPVFSECESVYYDGASQVICEFMRAGVNGAQNVTNDYYKIYAPGHSFQQTGNEDSYIFKVTYNNNGSSYTTSASNQNIGARWYIKK